MPQLRSSIQNLFSLGDLKDADNNEGSWSLREYFLRLATQCPTVVFDLATAQRVIKTDKKLPCFWEFALVFDPTLIVQRAEPLTWMWLAAAKFFAHPWTGPTIIPPIVEEFERLEQESKISKAQSKSKKCPASTPENPKGAKAHNSRPSPSVQMQTELTPPQGRSNPYQQTPPSDATPPRQQVVMSDAVHIIAGTPTGTQEASLPVVVVAAYWPNPLGTGESTVWAQHRSFFCSQGRQREPREAFMVDLLQAITQWRDEGCEVILGVNANEDISSTKSSSFRQRLCDVGMEEAILQRHPGRTAATQHRNNRGKPIDGIFTTSGIASVDHSGKDICQLVQAAASMWAGGISATGGAINPEKSFWCLIDFAWDGGKGQWTFRRKNQLLPDHRLQIPGLSGKLESLCCLEPGEAEKTLGVMLAPLEDQKAHVTHLKGIAKRWAEQVWSGHLHKYDVIPLIKSTVMKSLEYPMTQLTLEAATWVDIMSPVLQVCLPKAGICRSFLRDMVLAPLKFQGLGIPHLFGSQVSKHIETLLRHSTNKTKPEPTWKPLCKNISSKWALCSVSFSRIIATLPSWLLIHG
ncbi:unnamed protein product [Cylindrotheca closterium]|uniref:Uncharacterized protein n=1 Tax=Cylindrotheca closterium TaxID=2856 RepID=A0AAD2JJP5_9STRA|nr:unnamed protein product [Cylindrotheca closterium]